MLALLTSGPLLTREVWNLLLVLFEQVMLNFAAKVAILPRLS